MSFERRKIRIGRVVSDKMEKTVVVDVEWRSSHRLYKKAVRRRTRIYVHDPENQGRLGDVVQVIENRPTSKTKRWRLTDILETADLAELQPDEITIEDTSILVYTPDAPDESTSVDGESDDIVDEVAEAAVVEGTEDAVEDEQPVDEASDDEDDSEEEKAVAEVEDEQPVDEASDDDDSEEEEAVAEVEEEAVAEVEDEQPVDEASDDDNSETDDSSEEAEDVVEEPEESDENESEDKSERPE